MHLEVEVKVEIKAKIEGKVWFKVIVESLIFGHPQIPFFGK